MSGERLQLVTSMDQVKAGVELVDMRCGVCGRVFHRGTVVGLVETDEEGDRVGLAWEVAPYCGNDGPDHFNGVSADVIATGRIFRVVREAESSTTTDAARPLETVR